MPFELAIHLNSYQDLCRSLRGAQHQDQDAAPTMEFRLNLQVLALPHNIEILAARLYQQESSMKGMKSLLLGKVICY